MNERAAEITTQRATVEGVLVVPGMGSDHCAGIVRASLEGGCHPGAPGALRQARGHGR